MIPMVVNIHTFEEAAVRIWKKVEELSVFLKNDG